MSSHITWSEVLSDKFIKFACAYPKDRTTLVDDHHTYELSMMQALCNAAILSPLIIRDMPIPQELVYTGGLFTNNTIESIQTSILEKFIGDEATTDEINVLLNEFLSNNTRLSNIISTEMGAYYKPLDMSSMTKSLKNPVLVEALKSFDMNKALSKGTKYLQDAHKRYGDHVVKVFTTTKENNCFRAWLALGALNDKQFIRLVGSIGLVTDVDDTVIPIPITSNYLDGYDSINFYAIDSLTAKKSDHYSKNNMKDAQYNNRKNQLEASSIGMIKTGDCGSTLTLTAELTEETAPRYIGKYVVTDKGTVMISKKNLDLFINKRIKFRSSTVCRHKSSFCHACGGQMARYLPQQSNSGIAAVLEFISDLVQAILSAKHLSTTDIVVYDMARLLTEVFDVQDTDIYVKKDRNFNPDELMIGINITDSAHIQDLDYVRTDSLNERFFTRITTLSVANAVTGEVLVSNVPMSDEYGNAPYFSEDYLTMIRKDRKATYRDNQLVWFKLKGFDFNKPLIKIPSVSESALVFIKKIMDFFEKDVKKYKDLSHALHDLSSLVWRRSKVNIIHLETVLKACLTVSEDDFSLPLVENPKDVNFEGLREIIMNRHLGTEMAFERITEAITDPMFYIQKKDEGLFDQYLGTRDHIYPQDYGLLPVAERRIANRRRSNR